MTENKIVEWNKKTKMDSEPPANQAVVYCYLEELFEFLGLEEKDCKSLAKRYTQYMMDEAASRDAVATEDQQIDALCDMNFFGDGFIYRKGHDPVIAMEETIKEVDSREGSFDEENGKWKKDKSPEAMAKWYTANREISKLNK